MKRLDGTQGVADARAEIQDALEAYETALNGSDVDKVLDAFAPDGVFMAPNNPSAVGADAIRGAYQGIFAAIAFDTELTVAEVVQVAPDWAFARTDSSGFVTVHAIKQRVPDANHELFAFRKSDDGRWRIARYAFSSTLPAPR
jgi:uncharacterized protein (TIGR02246 family)